jgi:hypothetical protein
VAIPGGAVLRELPGNALAAEAELKSPDLVNPGKSAVLFALLLAAGPPLRAELHFEKTRVELKAKPDQEQIDAVFEFENRGTSSARIVTVVSGCQCLHAKFPAEAIAAGGKNRITGVFKVGNFPGVTEKTLQVRVEEDGKSRSLALTVAVELQELITIEPRTAAWTVGEARAERTFTVTMNGGDGPIRLLAVEPSRPGFTVRLETVKEGAEYRVHVTPSDLAEPALGVFRFKTDCKYPRFANPIAFGHVKKP